MRTCQRDLMMDQGASARRIVRQQATEAAFRLHFALAGVRVSMPIPSSAGELVEEMGAIGASLWTWAPDTCVDPGEAGWDEGLIDRWAAHLAAM